MQGTGVSGTRKLFAILSIAYASAIFMVSSMSNPGGGGVVWEDKVLHAGVFAILAILISITLNASRNNSKRLVIASLMTIAYGIFDEVHQHYVPLRTLSTYDVLADTAGAIVGVALFFALEHRWQFFLSKCLERIGIEDQ